MEGKAESRIKKKGLLLSGVKRMKVRGLQMKGVKKRKNIISFCHLYNIVYVVIFIVIT